MIKCDDKKKFALTQEQIDSLLDFVKSDVRRAKHYDEIVILMETGLCISELYGLTIDNVDLESRQIRVAQQPICASGSKAYIEAPKTKTGDRAVPLTDDAYEAFKRVLARRATQTCTKEIDGQTDFVFLSRTGSPLTAEMFRSALTIIVNRYNESHDTPLPNITPHILRHTFVSRLYDRGIDMKCLQIVAGHSNIQTTMNICTHVDYARVEDEFRRVTSPKQ